ncbi:MAG: hypothetical protein LZ158_04320 [Thaumarchaeota archaeon]|jgi:uncharacterized membrane protein (Fun14 family)|nr:hypothetical protein [Candidatus Terraquivivens yellowstonensis]MCL7387867.1 hypothetical protein [Candidatus Terraquivivens yellowstonensis]MCL7393100.1 hypothetical protein [Candidatus Terraquivivens yellowstonensis]MCL7395530.1 hypothetical protein [Candidatus Terraquivivens yellowstonensis]MCL7398136.1 hypothetical protein [Candidatus Terraquivivens yellowstonensis]
MIDYAVLITNIILFVVGFLIGFGVTKVLKGALLIIAAIIILSVVGITIAGFVLPSFGEIYRIMTSLEDVAKSFIEILKTYPMLTAGLLVGLIVGIVK